MPTGSRRAGRAGLDRRSCRRGAWRTTPRAPVAAWPARRTQGTLQHSEMHAGTDAGLSRIAAEGTPVVMCYALCRRTRYHWLGYHWATICRRSCQSERSCMHAGARARACMQGQACKRACMQGQACRRACMQGRACRRACMQAGLHARACKVSFNRSIPSIYRSIPSLYRSIPGKDQLKPVHPKHRPA